MGRRGEQWSLFYQFRLDERVPKDHLLRRIDRFVTAALADIHERLEPYYSEIGRPSVDPELMMRMLIVGYCYGLRSERRLTQEIATYASGPRGLGNEPFVSSLPVPCLRIFTRRRRTRSPRVSSACVRFRKRCPMCP